MSTPLFWDSSLVNKFWDKMSQDPEKYFTYQFGAVIAKKLAKHVRPNGRVLDYGCGTGFLLPHLANQHFQVFGTDTSPESVKFVNERFHEIHAFGGAKLLQQQLATDEEFDAVFVVEVIEHLNDESLAALLSNVRYLLNRGGVAIFTTPNDEKLSDSEVYCPVCDHSFHRWQHVRSWSVESLSEELAQHGFVVKACYGTNFALKRTGGIRGAIMDTLNSLIMPPTKPHLVAVCE
jgi:2-polyprenyl-3-methyl-5-hydroxy-6-metoxy-1,4-benzoquinol methylase